MKTYIHRTGMLRHRLTLILIFISLARFTLLLVVDGHIGTLYQFGATIPTISSSTEHAHATLPISYRAARWQLSLCDMVIHAFS